MDFYSFSAVAIPVLWAACRAAQPSFMPRKWHAASWLLLKGLLITGEVSTVVSLGRGHDSLIGAWLCAVALIAGGLVVVTPPVARDLAWLGAQDRRPISLAVLVAPAVGWLALRFA